MTPAIRSKHLTPHKLAKARAALAITQAELASRMGVTANTVARKESGNRAISIVDALAVECLLRREGVWREDWRADTSVPAVARP